MHIHTYILQSIDSMALEPYDERLLKEKGIKLMSFHAHLRKLNSVAGLSPCILHCMVRVCADVTMLMR
jgi:hypothetical protein